MASFTKIGKRWRARVRMNGFSPSEMFDTKAQAMIWATATEASIKARKYSDVGMISNMTVADLIDRYIDEVAALKPFGRGKAAVLESLRKALGTRKVPDLDGAALVEFVKHRLKAGAGGVTISIDLSYLKSVVVAAKDIWKLPVDPDMFKEARAYLAYVGISTKSKGRDRRVSNDELNKIKKFFMDKGARQKVPMWDIIDFAVATTMRDSEIMRITWEDVHSEDRTVIIRDRKHPKLKLGNHQTVPLLSAAWAIIQRQPMREGRIFPFNAETISTLFTRAVGELGLVDLRFHDLRHEGVSRLFEMGYRIEEVAVFSGHTDWKMLQRYTHIRARDLHRREIDGR